MLLAQYIEVGGFSVMSFESAKSNEFKLMTKLSHETSRANTETEKKNAVVERVKVCDPILLFGLGPLKVSVKRRPWRDKVRKKARKEALKASREKLKATNERFVSCSRVSIADIRATFKNQRRKFLNEQLYTMTGSEALEYFRQDPNAFRCYHNGFAEQVKKWPNHPLDVIIRWLKAKQKQLVVFDLGCGDAKIAAALGDFHK
ncbi:hypothetical protein ANCDUO_23379, partial [Ancylostoma duodenale]